MSFQAYLDTIKLKTGKTPDDFRALAQEKGLLESNVKAGQIVAWLKEDFGLGHGHAMAIVCELQADKQPTLSSEERIAKHFTGAKSVWRKSYDTLYADLCTNAKDITAAPTDSYISLLRGSKKFAIVQVTSQRLDIGIKVDIPSQGRLEESGKWNSMVTRRVRITDPSQIDEELIGWLHQAYKMA